MKALYSDLFPKEKMFKILPFLQTMTSLFFNSFYLSLLDTVFEKFDEESLQS